MNLVDVMDLEHEWGDLVWYKYKKDLVAAAILFEKELSERSIEVKELCEMKEISQCKGIVNEWKRVQRKSWYYTLKPTMKCVAKFVNYRL